MHNSPLFFAAGVPGRCPGRGPSNLHKFMRSRQGKFVQYFFVKGVDFSLSLWYNISVRGKDNKLYSNDNHSHFERERRYLERGEVTLQGFPLTTEVLAHSPQCRKAIRGVNNNVR